MGTIILVLFVTVAIGIVATWVSIGNAGDKLRAQALEADRTFLIGRSLEDYKAQHPESFDRGGRFVRCHACGGGQVFMKNYPSNVHHGHLCRQCGTELWRSKLAA